MGNYNPSAPSILGQEWRPIRNETVRLSNTSTSSFEVGHQFNLSTTQVLQDGRFYTEQMPASQTRLREYQIAVYPAGSESLTGPIRSVIIPCSSGGVTGTGAAIQRVSTVADALFTPGALSGYIELSAFAAAGVNSKLETFYAVSQYAQLLAGKRILAVNLKIQAVGCYTLHATQGLSGTIDLRNSTNTQSIIVAASNATSNVAGYPVIPGSESTLPGVDLPDIYRYSSVSALLLGPAPVDTLPLGESDFLSPVGGSITTGNMMPWTYDGLLRFDPSTAGRNSIYVTWEADNSRINYEMFVGYMALEVIFCEETRVAVGGKYFEYPTNGYGVNVVPLASPAYPFSTSPVLTAGSYTVAIHEAETRVTEGQNQGDISPINGLREISSLSGMNGVQINTTRILGETFTQETTHILPQLSLHTSGGPLKDVHVYGRQAVAQVYGSKTALQEIYDSPIGGARTWPQAKFIARRFGNTTVPLTLDCPAIPASTSSITPAAFDALDEIVDGWKEVTLSFSSPPSMGTGTNPEWRWSAAGEAAGNRWEVLGAYAPALSGVPGNLLNLVPSPHQLSIATYGQPVSGSQVQLGWMSGYAPPVSGTTEDATADAYLIFSYDMPPISGFTVSMGSQAVTGIGLDCGLNPCAIPTAILYSQLSWTAVTGSPAPVQIELQRMDSYDTTWRTIMLANSYAVSGAPSFRDYEARIGLTSSYRIRPVARYGFNGPWSPTVTLNVPTPGVSGGCLNNDAHVLVFTSNEYQNGLRNLAYSSVWEGSGARIDETFTYPEAGFVQLQAMYDRDDFVSFHSTERGGIQFTRNVLVQAAAVAAPNLNIQSLRDMAWSSASYICVRDEGGNRWFATVTVPSSHAVMRRRQQIAAITVTEVTQTPTQVSP
jgi:hypothetical protein